VLSPRFISTVVLSVSLSAGAAAQAPYLNATPFDFDPQGLTLSHAAWLAGIGCAPNGGTDPGCLAWDPRDVRNEGLLLAKTGQTGNPVAAGVRISGAKGRLFELGYDLRKPLLAADPRGSHCGAGAPRFNVISGGVRYFIGCSSPPAAQTPLGAGWIRLRWSGASLVGFGPGGLVSLDGAPIDSVEIVFDEGQDAGPDSFGLAVLDNIDVNGEIAGRGPQGGK
jgi:hypothetical protein